jgi:hypothetical protein
MASPAIGLAWPLLDRGSGPLGPFEKGKKTMKKAPFTVWLLFAAVLLALGACARNVK